MPPPPPRVTAQGPYGASRVAPPYYPMSQGYAYRQPGGAGGGAPGPGRGGGPVSSPFSIYSQYGMMNPNQIAARAQQMYQQQFLAQRQLIYSDYALRQKQAQQTMQAMSLAGQAAAQMNAGLIGQVGQQYQAGADQLAALGSPLAAQMSGATQAEVASANAAGANVGAPAVSEGGGAGTPGIAGPGQAAVETYRGATLPGQAMANAGGYAQAGMYGQIASQNLRATQEGQAAYMSAVRDAMNQRTMELNQLISQRPGAYSSLYNTLMSANMNMAQMMQLAQYRNAQIANAQASIQERYASIRQTALTASQKLVVDKWYKTQMAGIRSYAAQTGRINAGNMASYRQGMLGIAGQRASIAAQNAATARYRALHPSSGGGGPAPKNGRDPNYAGRSMQNVVANVTADYSKRFPNIRYDPETSFAWAWPRIRGYFKTPAARQQAMAYLRARTKAIKPPRSSVAVAGGGTGWGTMGHG